ncbi:hypothetical protein STEG23_006740 [Scotinomys teguina]
MSGRGHKAVSYRHIQNGLDSQLLKMILGLLIEFLICRLSTKLAAMALSNETHMSAKQGMRNINGFCIYMVPIISIAVLRRRAYSSRLGL